MGVGPSSVTTNVSPRRQPTGPTMKLANLSAVRNGTTETGGV